MKEEVEKIKQSKGNKLVILVSNNNSSEKEAYSHVSNTQHLNFKEL